MRYTRSFKGLVSFGISPTKIEFKGVGSLTYFLCFLLILNSSILFSQTQSFQFLNIPGNATLSALGGVNVSSVNQRVSFFQSNPALAMDSTNGWGSASYLFYFAGLGMANFSYQHNFDKMGPISFGVQHLGYGQLQGYDPSGVITNKFNAGETALFIGKSHRINNFRLGANIKGAFSNLAGYRSNAVMLDLGGVFIHPHQDLTVGLAIKNLGFVVTEYSATSTTKLPFDIQLGTSFKPEHMPLRFSITAHHLTAFDISYYNSTNGSEKPDTLDKVLRHFNFGAEVLIHKYVNLLLGYSFLKYKELKLETAGGGSGFSVGVLTSLKSMQLSISRTGYVTGGCYQFSLAANLEKIITSK